MTDIVIQMKETRNGIGSVRKENKKNSISPRKQMFTLSFTTNSVFSGTKQISKKYIDGEV
jgi:hypothetical protein